MRPFVIPCQRGRVALVTGANSGLGLETARALYASGAEVILACRSSAKAEKARDELLGVPSSGSVEIIDLDLADLSSISRAVRLTKACYGRLDLLINNAGVMAAPPGRTRDGFELQLGVNHLGHFALTLALLPLMHHQIDSRVVTVTSVARRFGRINFNDLHGRHDYNRWMAYCQSKLANAMFAAELQRRLAETGSCARSFAADPGFVRTSLQKTSVAASRSRMESLIHQLMKPLYRDAATGARAQLFAATNRDARVAHHGDAAACLRLWEASSGLCAPSRLEVAL